MEILAWESYATLATPAPGCRLPKGSQNSTRPVYGGCIAVVYHGGVGTSVGSSEGVGKVVVGICLFSVSSISKLHDPEPEPGPLFSSGNSVVGVGVGSTVGGEVVSIGVGVRTCVGTIVCSVGTGVPTCLFVESRRNGLWRWYQSLNSGTMCTNAEGGTGPVSPVS